MQIGNFFTNSIFYSPPNVALNRPLATAENVLQTAETAGSAQNLTGNYDLHNISPREIDLLAKELKLHQMISDSDMFNLLTHGAEYLSRLPDNPYSGEMLDQKIDLLASLEQQIAAEKAAGNPVEAHKNVLEFFRELEARNHLPVAGIIA